MTTTLLWFRRDLRLADNPALQAALARGAVLPVFIHAPEEEAPWAPGAASNWWLHHSLAALDADLRKRGSRLVIRRGPTLDALRALVKETGASAIVWNRLYEPAAIARDTAIQQSLKALGIEAESFNAALLCEPWTIQNAEGKPYRVFTPFWKKGLQPRLHELPEASLLPKRFPTASSLDSLKLDELDLLPRIRWDQGFHAQWQPGEAGAHTRLEQLLEGPLLLYAEGRERPDRRGTSLLSPHLHFGEISPRLIHRALSRQLALTPQAGLQTATEKYLTEIAWREFGYHLLYHFPHTAEQPLDKRFERFPWPSTDKTVLHRWQRGQTGFPIVDAGMRELWTTGWMHNRVRMIVASFLTKNLLVPWQEGARWFWDTLVDADLASNTLGWQWTAGCGADAAPYFRIFNPLTQAERFDPQSNYIRRWVPELGTPQYPAPMLDLKASRERALAAFAKIKSVSS